MAADETIAVVTPSALTAGEALSVEWVFSTDNEVSGTTGDLYPFEIELRSCGTDGLGCENGSCGTILSSLCTRAGVCMDSDGSYDVVIPADASAGDYMIRVSYLGPSSSSSGSTEPDVVSGCSRSFSVTEPDVPFGSPVISASSPQADLMIGEAFTAQWAYDNGKGGSNGNFDVNLYSCADGACDNGK